MARLETGKVQCGDDWPGVFIRGDNAMAYMMALHSLIQRSELGINELACNGLLDLLGEASVKNEIAPQMIAFPAPAVPQEGE